MNLKKAIRKIHLWLGLITGLVVFIVSITGCLWIFQEEISDIVYEHRLVEPKNKPIISISEALSIAKPHLGTINNINYLGENRCIEVRERINKNGKRYNNYVYLNPYTGEILGVKNYEWNFFDWVLQIHINLLLGKIGENIVAYSTLIFFFIILTGIYLWIPKTLKKLKKHLWFQWKKTTRWRRKNYDLHRIIGLYTSIFVIFPILTGLAWSFDWMDKGIQKTFGGSGGDNTTKIESIIIPNPLAPSVIKDSIFNQVSKRSPNAKSIWMYFPKNEKGTYSVYCQKESKTWYNAEEYHFDAYSSELLYSESFEDKTLAKQVKSMYFDIHIGQILGMPGKFLMFIVAFCSASLPITGLIIYIGRKKKRKK